MPVPSLKRLSAADLVQTCIVLACFANVSLHAQVITQAIPSGPQHSPAIILDPPLGPDLQAQNFDAKGHALQPAPANFRRLGEANVGEPADVHTLTLRFAATATLTAIAGTPDFPILQGSSCVKGNTYKRGTTCTLLVRFTPQGPGNRTGHLTITHTASAAPLSIGLGGFGYVPVLSFIPSVMQTVPSTFQAGAGILNGASNLATDGGDRLFMADTQHARILMVDSTSTLVNYSSSFVLPNPLGVTVDLNGNVWFTTASDHFMREFGAPNLLTTYLDGKTDACTATTAACTLGGETLTTPGELSADSYGNIFFSESNTGAAQSVVQPTPTLVRLFDIYGFSGRFASDFFDDLYSFRNGQCQIESQTLSAARNSNPSIYRLIAGSGFCGFSGDGGDARNARIGSVPGQFAFDAASNIYFTDSSNQRVRRIDYNTGVIRTIAGNGAPGYLGDGGAATSASLSSPTGLAVDSRGQVFIISGDGTAGTTQVVRKVTSQGILAFGNQARNTSSAARILTVTNTGNTEMVLTGFSVTGTNAGEFVVDPITTSCNLAAGSFLDSGNTCTVGVIFTPSGTGARSAKLLFVNNTVTNSNNVLLSGSGTLPLATVSIASPAPGQSFPSGTPVTLTANVVGASAGVGGTIQFLVDGVNSGSPVALLSGSASTTVTGLSVGSHTLGATYSGDSNNGAAGPVNVNISVTGTTTPSKVSLAPGVAAKGATSVTSFIVTVSSNDGTVPAGMVQLKDGNGLLATGSLANGRIVLRSPPLSPGVHSLTALYAGDGYHNPAVSPLVLEVISSDGQCSSPPPAPHPIHVNQP